MLFQNSIIDSIRTGSEKNSKKNKKNKSKNSSLFPPKPQKLPPLKHSSELENDILDDDEEDLEEESLNDKLHNNNTFKLKHYEEELDKTLRKLEDLTEGFKLL
jgi:hypothetical protein